VSDIEQIQTFYEFINIDTLCHIQYQKAVY